VDSLAQSLKEKRAAEAKAAVAKAAAKKAAEKTPVPVKAPARVPEPVPEMEADPRLIKNKTFRNSNEVPQAFIGTIENVSFEMSSLELRNFSDVTFKNCKFPKNFKFIRCNLHGAKGLPSDIQMEGCLKPKGA
jgi:hypothetical protein